MNRPQAPSLVHPFSLCEAQLPLHTHAHPLHNNSTQLTVGGVVRRAACSIVCVRSQLEEFRRKKQQEKAGGAAGGEHDTGLPSHQELVPGVHNNSHVLSCVRSDVCNVQVVPCQQRQQRLQQQMSALHHQQLTALRSHHHQPRCHLQHPLRKHQHPSNKWPLPHPRPHLPAAAAAFRCRRHSSSRRHHNNSHNSRRSNNQRRSHSRSSNSRL